MTHTEAKKNQGQRIVASENWVETDGRTDTTDRITLSANAVAPLHYVGKVLNQSMESM